MSSVKYRLSDAKLRGLTSLQKPMLDAEGRTVLVPNPGGKPYRFSDGTPGAPGGFSIYVGLQGARFECRTRVGGQPVRLSLGTAQEMTLEEAHKDAGVRKHAARHGVHPREELQDRLEAKAVRDTTVGEAMEEYIGALESLVARDKGKPSGVRGAINSLARLKREEIGLAGKRIADLRDPDVLKSWHALRHSAMLLSNRVPDDIKKSLTAYGPWWTLSYEQLREKLGLEGKRLALAYAAGMASAEHTMSDARRAVDRVIQRERKASALALRSPALTHNPFSVLQEEAMFRSTRELRKHYERARVRNPLGTDDSANGQKSLPSVLKSLVARRDMAQGWNATGIDYALLTLLWGTRRNEGARLKWYDACSKADLSEQRVSWAWLAPTPTSRNPTTGRTGSQVFLHDTKSGEFQLIPVAYFAERILRWRMDGRKQLEELLPKAIAEAEQKRAALEAERADNVRIAKALQAASYARTRLENARNWVFPVLRAVKKAKRGYYMDAKSLLASVKEDTGLADLDIGLTTHDFRRTLGRLASEHLPGHITSRLLHHHKPDDKEGMAKVSERYTEPEWGPLCTAMAKVDSAIIATSPRVWNMLIDAGDPAYPPMDESNDPPITVPKYRRRTPLDADD